MRAIDWNRILTILLVTLGFAVLGVVVWWLISRVAHTVTLLALAGVVTILLNPLVNRLQRRFRHRLPAVIVVAVAALVLFIIVAFALIQPLIEQLTALVNALPDWVGQIEANIPTWQERLDELGYPLDLSRVLNQSVANVQQYALSLLGNVVGIAGRIGSIIADIVLIVVLTVYLLQDGPRLAPAVNNLIPGPYRSHVITLEHTVSNVVSSYLRGQLILGAIIGLGAGAGTWLLGVRYSLIIGLFAGIMNLIPMFGAVIGAIPAIIIASFQSPQLALFTTLYFLILQQLEGNVLAPRIMGRAVGIHPLAILLALLAGTELFGLAAGLFIVPLIAITSTFVTHLWKEMRGGETARIGAAPHEGSEMRSGHGSPSEKEVRDDPTPPA